MRHQALADAARAAGPEGPIHVLTVQREGHGREDVGQGIRILKERGRENCQEAGLVRALHRAGASRQDNSKLRRT